MRKKLQGDSDSGLLHELMPPASEVPEIDAWLVSMIDGKNRECPYRQAYEEIKGLRASLADAQSEIAALNAQFANIAGSDLMARCR
jgi:hypothetical protein